jgi:hypothetical protein
MAQWRFPEISWPNKEARVRKIYGLLCLLTIGVLLAENAPARADSPIAPFIDSQTNAVIYVDISSLDLDQVNAWQQKAMASAKLDPELKARQQQQADQGIASAKKWISDFKTAGGKDLYVVVSLAGMMQGAPGGLIIPLNGAKPDALAKVFNPAGNPPPPDPADPNAAAMQRMQQQTAVVGNALVYSTGSGVDKLKTPSTEPRPDLTDALSAANGGTVRIAFVPSSLKSNPFFAAMMGARHMSGGAQSPPPFSEPQWDAVSWVSVSLTSPPKESGNCTIQCKDADSATALADLITKKIQDSKPDATKDGNMTTDEFDKLAAAVKPAVSGTQVVMTLDQNTLDNVVGPMMARAVQRNTRQRPQPGMGPNPEQPSPEQAPSEPQAPPPAAEPDNNGM